MSALEPVIATLIANTSEFTAAMDDAKAQMAELGAAADSSDAAADLGALGAAGSQAGNDVKDGAEDIAAGLGGAGVAAEDAEAKMRDTEDATKDLGDAAEDSGHKVSSVLGDGLSKLGNLLSNTGIPGVTSLGESFTRAGEEAAGLGGATGDLSVAQAVANARASELTVAQNNLAEANRALVSTSTDATASQTDLTAAMTAQADAEKAASDAADKNAAAQERLGVASDTTSGLVGFGKIATIGLGVAFAGAAAEGIHLADNMQQATTAIANSAEISTNAANSIGKAFLSTAGQSEFSGVQMAQAFAQVAGQLKSAQGAALTTAQSLQVMNVASDLATAKQISLGTATTALATTMQAFQIKAKDASNVSDILFNASNATGQSITALGAALDKVKTKLGGMAPPIGQLSGLLVDMTNHGETGRAAMQSLTTTFTAFLKPASDAATAQNDLKAAVEQLPPGLQALGAQVASGTLTSTQYTAATKDLTTSQAALIGNVKTAQGAFVTASDAAAKLGITTVTASGQMEPMSNIIAQLHDKIQGMNTAQATAELTALGFGNASAKLVTTIQAGSAAYDKATDAATKMGAAHAAAAKQAATLHVQLETIKASAEDVITEFGQFLVPVLGDVVHGFASLVKFIVDTKPLLYALAAIIGTTLVAAIGAFIVNGIGSLIASIRRAGSSITSLINNLTGLGSTAETEGEEAGTAIDTAATTMQTAATTMETAAATIAESFSGIGVAATTMAGDVSAATATVDGAMSTMTGDVEASGVTVDGALEGIATEADAAAVQVDTAMVNMGTAFESMAAKAEASSATADASLASTGTAAGAAEDVAGGAAAGGAEIGGAEELGAAAVGGGSLLAVLGPIAAGIGGVALATYGLDKAFAAAGGEDPFTAAEASLKNLSTSPADVGNSIQTVKDSITKAFESSNNPVAIPLSIIPQGAGNLSSSQLTAELAKALSNSQQIKTLLSSAQSQGDTGLVNLLKSLQKLQGAQSAVESQMQNSKAAAQTLGSQFGLTGSETSFLAQQLGINLNKSLSPAQLQAFGAAVRQMGGATGVAAAQTKVGFEEVGTAAINMKITASEAAKNTHDGVVAAMSPLVADLQTVGDKSTAGFVQRFIDAASKSGNASKNIHDQVFNPLEPLVGQLLSTGQNAAAGIVQAFINKQGDIGNAAKDMHDTTTKALQPLIADLQKTGDSAAVGLVAGLSAHDSDITTQAKSSATKGTAAFAGVSWTPVGAAGAQGVISGLQSQQGALNAAAANMATQAVAAAKSAAKISSPSQLTHDEVGVPLVQGIIGGIQSQTGALNSSLSGAVTEAANKAAGGTGSLSSQLKTLESAQKQATAAIGSGTIQATLAGTTAAKLGTEISTVKGEMQNSAAAARTLGSQFGISASQASFLAQQLGVNLNKSLTTAQIQAFGAAVKQMGGATGVAAAQSKVGFEEVGTAATNMKITASQAASDTHDGVVSAMKPLIPDLTTIGDKSTAGAIQKFIDAASKAGQASQNIHDRVFNPLEPLVGQLLSTGQNAAAGIVQSFVNKEGDMQTAGQRMHDTTVKALQPLIADLQKTGDSAAVGLVTGLGGHDTDITTQAKSSATKGTTAFGGVSWTPVGAAAGAGVISGLQSQQGALNSAAANMATQAVAAAKSAAKISSPSQLTHDEVGVPLVQGIIGGIQSQTGALNSSLSGAVTGAIPSIPTGGGIGVATPSGGGGGGISAQVVNQPINLVVNGQTLAQIVTQFQLRGARATGNIAGQYSGSTQTATATSINTNAVAR